MICLFLLIILIIYNTYFMLADFYNNFSRCCKFMVAWEKKQMETVSFNIKPQQKQIWQYCETVSNQPPL